MATSRTVIAVTGLGLVVLFGYLAYVNVDVKTTPDVEIAAVARLDAPSIGLAPHEYVTQDNSLVQQVTLPHRYPTVSGCNITALINHGFEPMRKRAPRDSRWIERPPAEVMF